MVALFRGTGGEVGTVARLLDLTALWIHIQKSKNHKQATLAPVPNILQPAEKIYTKKNSENPNRIKMVKMYAKVGKNCFSICNLKSIRIWRNSQFSKLLNTFRECYIVR